MRPRRHLIDDQTALADKEFNAHGADVAELLGNPGSDILGVATQTDGGSRRHDGDIENALGVLVFTRRKTAHLALFIPRQNNGNFVIELQALFENTGLAFETGKSQQRFLTIADHRLPLAVVTEAGNLENGGKKIGRRDFDIVFAANFGERPMRQAVIAQE